MLNISFYRVLPNSLNISNYEIFWSGNNFCVRSRGDLPRKTIKSVADTHLKGGICHTFLI